MRLWRRGNDVDDVTLPKEVQDYYAAENRERRGVAGLLAVGTLVATILIAVGLFFGGRWAYRSLRHQDKKASGPVKTAVSSTSTDKSNKSSQNSGNNDNSAANKPGWSDSHPSTGTPTIKQPSVTKPNVTSPPTSPVGNAGGSSSTDNLPKTGPAGSISAFVMATLVSVAGAELYQRRKLRR